MPSTGPVVSVSGPRGNPRPGGRAPATTTSTTSTTTTSTAPPTTTTTSTTTTSTTTTAPPTTTTTSTTSTTTTTTAAPSGFVYDSFTGSDGTHLNAHTGETGATWTYHGSFGGSDFLIDTNRIKANNGANTTVAYASGVPASADYSVTAVLRCVSVEATEFLGPVGRVDTAAGNFYAAIPLAGSWYLYLWTGGSPVALGFYTAALTPGQDYTVTLTMTGTTIKLTLDGVDRVTATDGTVSAAGRAGVVGYYASGPGLRLSSLQAL